LSDFQIPISCRYAGVCGGCPWILKDLESQREEKLKGLHGFFPQDQIEILSAGSQRLRDRVDMTLKRLPDGSMALGLWSLGTSGKGPSLGERELVDMQACPMMSEELETWFLEFRTRLPVVSLGSVRLRVGPGGLRGVWLDFSNEDVKGLFEEKEYLRWLSAKAVVEIGQKKKPLYFDENGEPHLKKELNLKPWFQTWDLQGRAYPVPSAIGGFSQSGLKANRLLTEAVLRQCVTPVENSPALWVEAFCGSGNFTYPLARTVEKLIAFDNDAVALKALEEGLQELGLEGVELSRVDLKSPRQTEALAQRLAGEASYGMLADPPRSGLMKLLDFMEEGLLKPSRLVYVSCFTESLLKDGERLKALGYGLESLSLVDQFPHSPHVEWISLWTKSPSENS